MKSNRPWKTLAVAALLAAGAGGAGAAFASFVASPTQGTAITVYKTPTCGCCAKWVEHLRANDFRVTTKDMEDLSGVKKRRGVPSALSSCHTALVGGYVVEGHVPADVIRRLLSERPRVVGVAVPGMPVGAPGMEGAPADKYDVVTFDRGGKTQVYERR